MARTGSGSGDVWSESSDKGLLRDALLVSLPGEHFGLHGVLDEAELIRAMRSAIVLCTPFTIKYNLAAGSDRSASTAWDCPS